MDAPIRVLYIENEPEFAELTRKILERQRPGFDVETVSNGEETLDRLDAERADCIISDYDLPGMNGLELLESVRASYPNLPFILFTGKGSEEVASEAISAGVTDYLQKQGGPSQFALLSNRVENAVAQYRSSSELERTELRYRRLIEETNDVIVIVDGNGVYQYLSPAAERVLGYPPEELEGEVGFEYIHPDDAEKTAELFFSMVEEPSRRPTAEFRFLHKDGSWMWLEVMGRNLSDDPNIGGMVVYAREITERKERERTIERERDRLSTLFENVPTPVIHADMTAEGPIIKQVNPAFEDVFGYDREAIVGRNIDDVAVPDDRIAEAAAINEQLVKEGQFQDEVARLTAHGIRDFILTGALREPSGEQPEGYAIYTDITERAAHEQQLETIRERMAFALDATDSYIFELDRSDGSETRHGAFERLYGIAPEDIPTTAMFYERAVHPDDRDELERFQQEDLPRAPGKPKEIEFRTHPDTDQQRWIKSAAYAREGEPTRIIGLATDVTERRERERELNRQNERLDEFSSVVSHDLRNPLNIAAGRLEMIADECGSEHIEVVEQALERMNLLIENLLTLAREGEHARERTPVDLERVSENCWRNVATGDATIEIDGDLTFVAHRPQLQQLFENLMRNAVEHGGESVTVRVGQLDGESGFFVEDDGRGIPEEERERVLQSRYTTSSEGTGLGLAIVRRIVETHGWELSQTDGSAGGARFEFTGVELVD